MTEVTPGVENTVVTTPTEETPAIEPVVEAVPTGQEATDGKPAEAQKPEGAPETYEAFTLPEDMPVNEELTNQFSSVAKDLNLTQEQAQKLVDIQTQEMVKGQEAQQKRWDDLRTQWTDSSRTDSEFGGTNFEANVGLAKKALDEFGTPELREALDLTGTGSHPELVRFFYRVGKAISEDAMRVGSNTGVAKDPAKKLYPDMN